MHKRVAARVSRLTKHRKDRKQCHRASRSQYCCPSTATKGDQCATDRFPRDASAAAEHTGDMTWVDGRRHAVGTTISVASGSDTYSVAEPTSCWTTARPQAGVVLFFCLSLRHRKAWHGHAPLQALTPGLHARVALRVRALRIEAGERGPRARHAEVGARATAAATASRHRPRWRGRCSYPNPGLGGLRPQGGSSFAKGGVTFRRRGSKGSQAWKTVA